MAQPTQDDDGRLLPDVKARRRQPDGYLRTNAQLVAALALILAATRQASKLIEWAEL